MKVLHRTALIVFALAVPAALSAADKPNVDYPAGYRGWTHVKSKVILPGNPLFDAQAGIHHIYANPAALEGYKTGLFPDGSIIAFDRLEAVNADNAITEVNARFSA
jgi:Cytochrome P460